MSEQEQKETEKEEKEERTAGKAIIEELKEQGVEVLFGVTGGTIMPVYDHLHNEEELEFIMTGHEQGATHAAEGYNTVTGRPGVCMVTSGPGATNLVTGLADADMDSRGVVAISGQVPKDMIGNDAFQETDARGVSMPVTKHNYLVENADETPETVSEAFHLASTGRQGPVLVDIPKDIAQNEKTKLTGGDVEIEGYSPNYQGHPGQIEKAVKAIKRSKKPLLFSGGGVIAAEASEEIRKFAIENDIPVTTSLMGLGSFPEDNELSLGMLGMHGTGYANRAVTDCDLLLGVGVRFDDRATGKIENFAPEAKVIHIDIDPSEISKNIHADIPIVGDAKEVMRDLNDAIDKSPDTDEWLKQIYEWKQQYPMEYDKTDADGLLPQWVVEKTDEMTPDDTIVVTGVGQHQMWAAQWYTYTKPRTWVTSGGLGTMGFGLPASIGAKIGAPDQEVVCIDGDGSFIMTLQELITAVREELDFTHIIINNSYHGMVRQWQELFYDERYTASELYLPRFDKIAEAFGAHGERVETEEEFKDAMEEAFEYDGPSVLDVIVETSEKVFPMVPAGAGNDEFLMGKGTKGSKIS